MFKIQDSRKFICHMHNNYFCVHLCCVCAAAFVRHSGGPGDAHASGDRSARCRGYGDGGPAGLGPCPRGNRVLPELEEGWRQVITSLHLTPLVESHPITTPHSPVLVLPHQYTSLPCFSLTNLALGVIFMLETWISPRVIATTAQPAFVDCKPKCL